MSDYYCPDLIKRSVHVDYTLYPRKIIVLFFGNAAKISEDYCKSFCFGKGCVHYRGSFPCPRAVTFDVVKGYLRSEVQRIKEFFKGVPVIVIDAENIRSVCCDEDRQV